MAFRALWQRLLLGALSIMPHDPDVGMTALFGPKEERQKWRRITAFRIKRGNCGNLQTLVALAYILVRLLSC